MNIWQYEFFITIETVKIRSFHSIKLIYENFLLIRIYGLFLEVDYEYLSSKNSI